MRLSISACTVAAFSVAPSTSPCANGNAPCLAIHPSPGENVCCAYIYERQSWSSCIDRLFRLRNLEFLLGRDAVMGFTFIFDAILQFLAQ
jgi:hypothetical protein